MEQQSATILRRDLCLGKISMGGGGPSEIQNLQLIEGGL